MVCNFTSTKDVNCQAEFIITPLIVYENLVRYHEGAPEGRERCVQGTSLTEVIQPEETGELTLPEVF